MSAGLQVRDTPEMGLFAGLLAVAMLFCLLAVLVHALGPAPVPAPQEAAGAESELLAPKGLREAQVSAEVPSQ